MNLTILPRQVGWVDESWHLEMSFSSDSELSEPNKTEQFEISTEPESYKNKTTKAEITGLCSSYQYNICLQLIKDESMKTEPFCQVTYYIVCSMLYKQHTT